MRTKFSVLRSKGVKFVAATGAMLSTVAAHAIDSAPITAAQADGVDAVTLTVAGLIGIVAIVVGVNIVMSLLKKA